MANFYSNVNGISLSGTASDDTISIHANHTTVTALDGNDYISVNGGQNAPFYKNDTDKTEEAVIFADAGDDTVKVETRGVTVYGGQGKDYITYNGYGGAYGDANFYADGGADGDHFFLSNYVSSKDYDGKSAITLKGGSGNDTVEVKIDSGANYDGGKYDGSKAMSFVVEDFNAEDTFTISLGSNDSLGKLSYSTITGGHVVLTDGNNFTATLLGAGSLANTFRAAFILSGLALYVSSKIRLFFLPFLFCNLPLMF